MDEPSADDMREEEWARARIRQYLLGRLSDEEADRFADDAALLDGFACDLAEAEEALLTEHLEGRLPIADQGDFARRYTNGPEHQRIRLRVERILHEERSQPIEARRKEVPWWRTVPDRFFFKPLVPATALLVVVVTGVAVYRLSHIFHEPAADGTQGQEQPAGDQQQKGLLLDEAAPSNSRTTVENAPGRITWVVDYRARYRIRVRAINGAEVTSPVLAPKNNEVTYSVANPASLPLPWEVFLLNADPADETVRSHYTVSRQ